MDSSKTSAEYIVKIVFVLLLLISCSAEVEKETVIIGADILIEEHLDLIESQTVGIITNHTALLSDGKHLVDTLHALNSVNVKCLFGPEHGIRGDAPDGESIGNGVDNLTGLPIISLYGQTRKPSAEMLVNIDVLIFDIQDIGARFYTYISTMFYSIQSAAENNIKIIILDRPNPIGGHRVEGPILKTEFRSFVGISQIPIRHGMTVGELAMFFNRKEILRTSQIADLKVIKMKNWKRHYYYDDCNIKWVKPSPNMPDLETALIYPGMCLLEATNISEGRGTYSPFLKIGSPFLNSIKLIEKMGKFNFKGISIAPVHFTPVEIPNMSKDPKYENEFCEGVKFEITDRNEFNPIEFGITLISILKRIHSDEFNISDKRMDKLWGSDELRLSLDKGISPSEIIKMHIDELEDFKKQREKFLLY